jgi:hypothetical protein
MREMQCIQQQCFSMHHCTTSDWFQRSNEQIRWILMSEVGKACNEEKYLRGHCWVTSKKTFESVLHYYYGVIQTHQKIFSGTVLQW